MSLRGPLARGYWAHTFKNPASLPRAQLGTRRWICYHCRQDSVTQASQAWNSAIESSSSGKLVSNRGKSTHLILSIRSFATSTSRSSEERIEAEGGAVAPKKESFDQRLRRMAETTRCSWNELVGYTDIEKERKRVEAQEQTIEQKRLELQEARDDYRMAVDKHAASLRESRDLLGRRDEWSESDAARFAALHTMVKTNEQTEYGTRQALSAAELGLEREIERLSSKIGAVYQAESMYNAKILQMKTWWTWALFIFNASVFVFNLYLLQVGLNPKSMKAEVVLADDTIRRLSVKLAQSVATATNHNDLRAPVEAANNTTEHAFGPLAVQNGAIFYRDAEINVEASDTISKVKDKILSIEEMPSAKLVLISNGNELEDTKRIEDFSADVQHTIEIFATELTETDLHLLSIDDLRTPTIDKSTLDRIQNLFSDQIVSVRVRDATFTVLQSALAGAAIACLVTLGLERG